MTTGRTWLAGLSALLLLAIVVGVLAPDRQATVPGAALGPGGREKVSDYTARAAASLDDVGPAEQRWALLSPTVELDSAAAAELVQGLRTSRVLLRVPLPRVQTPLDALEVADQGDLTGELSELERLAGGHQKALAEVSTGRAAAVAAAAGARLTAGCACVVGLVVRGTGDALRAVAARPLVRTLELAPSDTGYGGLSVVPLLPSQSNTVLPGPDDGELPDVVLPSGGISGPAPGG